jgi:hypothetical protein
MLRSSRPSWGLPNLLSLVGVLGSTGVLGLAGGEAGLAVGYGE